MRTRRVSGGVPVEMPTSELAASPGVRPVIGVYPDTPGLFPEPDEFRKKLDRVQDFYERVVPVLCAESPK